MRAARGRLEALRRGTGAETRTTCIAVGHAHIDTAWLWPIRETPPQVRAPVEQRAAPDGSVPRVQFPLQPGAAVRVGRAGCADAVQRDRTRGRPTAWEPFGAMWIEPDCSCPSGESFIRQILHGVGYSRERSANSRAARLLYLPDTFGFPAPAADMKLAGIDTFITNKMSWYESNRFPHVTFHWRGLDGTDVLTHFTPGHDYNSSIEAADLLHGERNLLAQDGVGFTASARSRSGSSPSATATGEAARPRRRSPAPNLPPTARDCRASSRARWGRSASGCTPVRRRCCAGCGPHRGSMGRRALPRAAPRHLHEPGFDQAADRFAESLLRDVEALACSVPARPTAPAGRVPRDARPAVEAGASQPVP